MQIPEDIFDIALTRLIDGEQIDTIANDFPEYREELVSLLSVSESGLKIPKLQVPAPYKRHLYAEKVTLASRVWTALQFSKTAIVPVALILALFGGRTIVKATNDSLPGDRLYTLKRATENARLALTSNPEKLAVIHVELMQNRIDEVKKAASTGNQTAEAAAIAELQSQTSKTMAEAAPVATANAISKQDSTLLDSLLAVNKQQKDVLQDLQKDDATKTVASTALEDSKKTDQTLVKIIATVNDQVLADLPNKISITGNITSNFGNNIVVEKNLFTINDKTSITNIDGQLTTDTTMLNGRATVIGIRQDNGTIIAKQIVLLPEDTGLVKGDVDPKPVVKPAVKPVEPKPVVTSPTTPPASDDQTSTEIQQPSTPASPGTTTTTTPTNQATGSFISEPSTQQYNQ